MDSDQKSIPVVGFLTCNDCDVLRTKTGIYRRVTYRTIILPTLAQYHDFRDVFSKEAFDKLPPWEAWDHAIDLTPETELPHSQTFPLSPAEQKELDNFLQENLANGCIHPSKSPMGAPVFFVKKKDGSLCLIQDYQKLNEITVKNSCPLPLVSNVLTHLCNAEFFTVLDLQLGFNNMWIKEGDEWKAAFQTNTN